MIETLYQSLVKRRSSYLFVFPASTPCQSWFRE